MSNEVEDLARYLVRVRLQLGEWPKNLIVHPSLDIEVAKKAIVRAKEIFGEKTCSTD